ncbi:hypothetical protein GQX74_004190 [Glossina fuscipes]|nr:hypothetical protein GQX74_004190 [Glossina fuscipes]
MKDVDEKFKRLANDNVDDATVDDDVDNVDVDSMVLIDESRLYDLNYLNELSKAEMRGAYNAMESEQGIVMHAYESETLWQSMNSQHSNDGCHTTNVMPDIMTTSCYGTLNNSYGSEISEPHSEQSTTIFKQSTPKKQEPIYATPEKRRDCNRSFDSSCPSYSSSLGGGAGSLTSSLDLKWANLSANVDAFHGSIENHTEIFCNSMDDLKTDWNSSGGIISQAEEVTEEAVIKCITAAENDIWSEFRRQTKNITRSETQSTHHTLHGEKKLRDVPPCLSYKRY